MDFPRLISDNGQSSHTHFPFADIFMTTKTAAAPVAVPTAPHTSPPVAAETEAQRFDRVLARP